MEDELADTKQLIDDLTARKTQCTKRIEKAGKLTELLSGEGTRWEEEIKKLNEDKVYIAGNVFLAAA